MYAKETRSIRVIVTPQFLEDESKPNVGHFIWSYRIEIENLGQDSVQLLQRCWRITDGFGVTKEVVGEGVVGEKPVLDPGDTYVYTSAVPLRTPSGIMSGSYKMISEFDEEFEVEVPAFSLDSPYEYSSLH